MPNEGWAGTVRRIRAKRSYRPALRLFVHLNLSAAARTLSALIFDEAKLAAALKPRDFNL